MWKRYLAGLAATATLGAGGVTVADRQANPYTDKGAHYELPIKTDIPQGERVEIAKDKAELTLKGWNDEYAITITPQIPTASLGAIDRPFNTPADRPLLSKKMEYREGEVTAFIEPKEGTENEFDIDFTLHSRPDTNIFTYKIEGAEDFDFFYQPELTAEEIAEGAQRPDNVTGSYAVYHKTKANHRVGDTNYAAGKVFHVYRPKAIDANGEEMWAELTYADGVLAVSVPKDWLTKAAYPVVVDPTFGYTTQGASSSTGLCTNTASVRRGDLATGASGTLDKITANLSKSTSASITFTFFLNSKDSGGAGTHNEIARAESSLSLTSTKTWFDITMAGQSLTAIDYITTASCSYGSSSNTPAISFDTFTSTGVYFESFADYAASKESPWTSPTFNTTVYYSIYATYTASGGGAVDDTRPPDDAFFD